MTQGQDKTTARRVVVTGIGAICAVGNCVDEVWASLIAGRSGIGPITRFDASGYETRIAGEVTGFDPVATVGKKDARRTDRYTQLAIAATEEAMRSAGLAITEANADRVGVIYGSAMGGAETFEQGVETLLAQGPRRISPFFMPMMLINMAAGTLAIRLGAKANNFAPVSACASSAHAVGEAMRIIQRGDADAIIAGGSEAPVTRMSVAGFSAMGALSKRNDDPQGASRPFDAGRDGFVPGEGAATLILEEREHARARGATILAELAGYGATDDANHMVQPAPGGEGAARALGLALAEAGIAPADLGYINAHGTSTPLNERLETAAVKRALGDAAYGTPMSSTKSMTGHLLGAAGGLEAVVCVRALQTGTLPPTINQETADPDCDLDYIPNTARQTTIRYAMTNSMGFGGHNVSLILTQPDAAE